MAEIHFHQWKLVNNKEDNKTGLELLWNYGKKQIIWMILKSKLSPIDGIISDKKIFRVRLVVALIAESLDFKIF